MNVLSVVHGEDAGTELFAPLVAEAGHRLREWSFAERGAPPSGSYDAVMVLGGAMHVDQHDRHPWLSEETDWLREFVARRVPTLGICLGSQLLAAALGASVGPLAEPEIGWHEVELTSERVGDRLFGALPQRFEAFQWHHYAHDLPDGAVALARNDRCLQAFALDSNDCWGVQFHPEVTEPQIDGWIADESDPPPDPDGLRAETRAKIGAWNELGRRLCRSFLAAAEPLRAG
jgi:GMP synthase-like glutamine amidotransferase